MLDLAWSYSRPDAYLSIDIFHVLSFWVADELCWIEVVDYEWVTSYSLSHCLCLLSHCRQDQFSAGFVGSLQHGESV